VAPTPDKTFRVWVHGYVDIKAWTPQHAEHLAQNCIIISDGKQFACLNGPEPHTTVEESPK
jgi:hypothetical protein